jgi:sporulation integral membrane protein YtvI
MLGGIAARAGRKGYGAKEHGMTVENKKNFIINIAFLLVCFGLIYLIVKFALPWLFPFIIALGMAAVLNRPIVWISSKTHVGRGFVAVFFVLLIFSILGVLLFLIGYQLVESAIGMTNIVVDFAKRVLPLTVQTLTLYIDELPPDTAEALLTAARALTDALQNGLVSLATSVANSLVSFTTVGLPGFLIGFIITVVSCCYVSRDYIAVITFLSRLIPRRYRQVATQVKGYFITTGLTLLRSYVLLMTLTFFELFVFLSLFRIEHALPIAALIAVIDVLPVLGTGTVLIPWALISFIMGNWPMGIKVLIAYTVVTIVRNVAEPRLIGGQIGINPIFTLVAMYVGLRLSGVLGMFIMVFVVIMIKNLHDAGQFQFLNGD